MVSQLSARLFADHLTPSGSSSDTSSDASSSSTGARSYDIGTRVRQAPEAASASSCSQQARKQSASTYPSTTASTASSRPSGKKQRNSYSTASLPKSVGGASGYSADLESLRQRNGPPASVDMIISARNQRKREHASLKGFCLGYSSRSRAGGGSSHQQHEKRRKRDEMNYLATVVKAEMARGGLPLQATIIQSGVRSRVLPPGSGVDMSTVRLVSYRDVADSPFLIEHSACHDHSKINAEASETIVKQMPTPFYSSFFNHPIVLRGMDDKPEENAESSAVYDCLSALNNMIRSCSHMYELNNNNVSNDANTSGLNDGGDASGNESSGSNRSDAESITSSVTVADSDIVVAKLTKVVPKPFLSIGEALSITNNARLIVLAASPYVVIQANASFLRFTGTTSLHVLGRQLRDLLIDESLLDQLKKSYKTFGPTILPSGSSSFKGASGSIDNCTPSKAQQVDLLQSQYGKITISPVGSHRNAITHFAIEIEHIATPSGVNDVRSNTINGYNNSNDGGHAWNNGFAMNVMG